VYRKKIFDMKNTSFLFFKIFLWVFLGIFFVTFSILIPTGSDNSIKEILLFLGLALVANLHTSFLYPKIAKKFKVGYIIIFIGSIFLCALLEIALFADNMNASYYTFINRKKMFAVFASYIIVRDSALFVFFLWVESFNRLIYFLYKNEQIHQKEMALLVEKQEFEKKFSRKKLLPHYCFNIIEHIFAHSFAKNKNHEFFDKLKFVLYYFLVDAEKDRVELEKELVFYKYYIELENLRFNNRISVNFSIMGDVENIYVIPLLFEPLVGNALKYAKRDGCGWINIDFHVENSSLLIFRCSNNYSKNSSGIVSSENGLKILEQRLELCYKNKYALTFNQGIDLYEVTLCLTV
jgi:sensor histidine kinase YesM